MGVKVQWDDPEQTLIRVDMLGRWTWDEFYTVFEDLKLMIMGKSAVVHVISVMENPFHLPGNPLFQLNNFLRNAPPNLGMTMIVGANKYAQPFLPIASRFYPHIVKKVEFASSIEEAKTFLKQL